MKTIISFITVLLFIIVGNAQTPDKKELPPHVIICSLPSPHLDKNSPKTVNRVKEMAVFPGCEQSKGKRFLIKCFQEKLNQRILPLLKVEAFPKTNKERVACRVEFVIDTTGFIKGVAPRYGDSIFMPTAKKIMEKVAQSLKRNGEMIQPAIMDDDSKTELIFTHDIRMYNPNNTKKKNKP